LGFFLLSVWIKSIEDLIVDAKSKFSRQDEKDEEEKEEKNEIEILQKIFSDVHNELQEKVTQLNVYSQKLLESNIKLSELSITDELTTLYNRRYFDLRLNEEVRRHQKHNHNIALIMVDVDGFKQFNDLNGHPAGDELLKDLGQLIRSSIRKSDIPSRYGGDEFAIICPECDEKEANLIAKRLSETFTARGYSYTKEDSTVTVSVSSGIALNGEKPEEFVAQADKNLYEVKNSTKAT
jgi:diguanylate cyclase (GGDEF)-like protein